MEKAKIKKALELLEDVSEAIFSYGVASEAQGIYEEKGSRAYFSDYFFEISYRAGELAKRYEHEAKVKVSTLSGLAGYEGEDPTTPFQRHRAIAIRQIVETDDKFKELREADGYERAIDTFDWTEEDDYRMI